MNRDRREQINFNAVLEDMQIPNGWLAIAADHRAEAAGNRVPQMGGRPAFDINQAHLGNRRRIEVVQQNQQQNMGLPQQQLQNHQQQQQQLRRQNRRREQRHRDPRDEQERIDFMAQRNYTTRTAIEFDDRENQCWSSLNKSMSERKDLFRNAVPNGGPDVFVPTEMMICNMLKHENQIETIRAARDVLLDYGATEHNILHAIQKLDIHLKNNCAELEILEDATKTILESIDKLMAEMSNLDSILTKVDNIVIQ